MVVVVVVSVLPAGVDHSAWLMLPRLLLPVTSRARNTGLLVGGSGGARKGCCWCEDRVEEEGAAKTEGEGEGALPDLAVPGDGEVADEGWGL